MKSIEMFVLHLVKLISAHHYNDTVLENIDSVNTAVQFSSYNFLSLSQLFYVKAKALQIFSSHFDGSGLT